MEQNDPKQFKKLMAFGGALVDCAEDGDAEGFKQVFEQASQFGDLMFWHTQKSLRVAVQRKHLFVIEFLIDDLEMSLRNQCFEGFLHSFIRQCVEDEENEDDAEIEANQQIMRYLAKAAGKEGLDQMESITGNTVLHTACQFLNDFVIIDTLIQNGADVNAVREDDSLPLNIINAKLKLEPENSTLLDIKELLERRGARTDWRNYN